MTWQNWYSHLLPLRRLHVRDTDPLAAAVFTWRVRTSTYVYLWATSGFRPPFTEMTAIYCLWRKGSHGPCESHQPGAGPRAG